MYYNTSRYYDPEIGKFINADDITYLDPNTINGLNLYSYCLNNPIMMVDPTGNAPWWSWAISGLQLAAGIALCFVPGGQGFGVSLIVGGALGLIANAAAPAVGQFIGGAGSINKWMGCFLNRNVNTWSRFARINRWYSINGCWWSNNDFWG